MRFVSVFLFSGLLVLLGSCEREKEDKKEELPDVSGTKVLVLCEGNFQWGNADFDIYYADSQKLVSEVFKKQNNNLPLGDILQSGVISDGLLWLVVNNSGKIVGLDTSDFTQKAEIKGLKSPRFLLPLGNGDAWVTDLYSDKISVLNLASKTVTSSFFCKGWTENIVHLGNEVAIAASTGKVYWASKTSSSITDSTLLRTGSRWIIADKNADLWALASDSGKSVLYKVSGTTHQVLKKFDLSGDAMKIARNPSGDSIHFLNNGLYAIGISDNAISGAPLFTESGFSWYGLDIDRYSGKIYICNARDYVSKGEVVELSQSGKLLHRFSVGVNPTSFVFAR